MRLMIGPLSSVGLVHVATAMVSKSERPVGRVEDSQNLQQRYDDSSFGLCRNSPRGGSLLAFVLQSSCSPPVLTLCLFLLAVAS